MKTYGHLTQYLTREKRVSTSSLGDIKGHRTGAMDINGHSPDLQLDAPLAEVGFS